MSAIDYSALKGAPLPQRSLVQRIFGSVAMSVLIYAGVMAAIVYGSYVGAQNMGYNWQWSRVPQFLWEQTDDGFQLGEIFQGLGVTLQLELRVIEFGDDIATVHVGPLLKPHGLAIGVT